MIRANHRRGETGRGPRRPGAAAVELAILLPFLMLMFAAALDFGRIFYATQVLESAACSGAMYASGTAWVPGSVETPSAAAVAAVCAAGAALGPPVRPDQVTVTIVAGDSATVTVTYDYALLTGALVPGGTVQLQRSVVVKLAPQPGS